MNGVSYEWCFLNRLWTVFLMNGVAYDWWCPYNASHELSNVCPYECVAYDRWCPYIIMWHDSFICVTWLIHMCDMTHSYVWCCVWLMVSLHYQWWSFESLNRLWLVFLISGVLYEWCFLWMVFRESTVNGRPYEWCSVWMVVSLHYEWWSFKSLNVRWMVLCVCVCVCVCSLDWHTAMQLWTSDTVA